MVGFEPRINWQTLKIEGGYCMMNFFVVELKKGDPQKPDIIGSYPGSQWRGEPRCLNINTGLKLISQC